ncbi:MAG: class I SAM-dependent methyltransferase [Spirochaetia bacterium]|nr:class I SAM-dependent methyltransferase [Spirochaetia bacterium]
MTKYQMFQNRLVKMKRHLGKWARRQGISCYRLYYRDIPQFPVSIDVYSDRLYVSEYATSYEQTESEHAEWLAETIKIIAESLEVPAAKIHLKIRQRQRGMDQYQKLSDSKNDFVVEEGGLKFLVNLEDYLDTGLFLDHRITRSLVRSEAGGRSFLNLFAYTGSFSVYAAAGGAVRTQTIDMSNTYLDWAGENMRLNGFDITGPHSLLRADVLEYLQRPVEETFDLALVDPPTFSNSKKMQGIFDVQRDHTTLLASVLKRMSPGGVVFFSTSYTKFKLNTEALEVSTVKDITKETTPKDFEGSRPRYCFRIVAGLLLSFSAAFAFPRCDMDQEPPFMVPRSKREAIAQGRQLFVLYGCVSCHGEGGRGDGPLSRKLNPKPRDLRRPSTYKQGASEQDIAKTIASGIPGTAMPAAPHIPPTERGTIAVFIKSIQKKKW